MTPPRCAPIPQALPLLAAWTDDDHAALADLGYEGERGALTTPIKYRAGCRLTDDQRTVNLLHAAVRAPAERGNSLLKTTFKALRRVASAPGASAPSPPPLTFCPTSTAAPHGRRRGGRTGVRPVHLRGLFGGGCGWVNRLLNSE
jgi:hypothetical protein